MTTATIDMGRSLPPLVPLVHDAIAATLRAMADDAQPGLLLHRAGGAGNERHAAAAARWLERRLGPAVDPALVVMSNGTQTLVRMLFETFCAPGEPVLAETLSYGVVRQLAALARVRLVGVDIDADGLIPEAFEAACARTGSRLLYCNPTVQNPVTAVMPPERRRRVGDIARRFGVTIVEDDVLGPIHRDAPPPIAATHADVTWYVQSTTKPLAHGLRVAYAVGPSRTAVDALVDPVRRLSFWVPAPLNVEVTTRWIETGCAGAVLDAVRVEAEAREAMARQFLGEFGLVTRPGSFHAWLPTGSVGGTAFAAQALVDGVILRAGRDFSVDQPERDIPFVRLSLSSPLHRDDVEQALVRLREIGRRLRLGGGGVGLTDRA